MDWFLYDNGLRHERVKKWKNVKMLPQECISFPKQFFKVTTSKGEVKV